ncbi:BatA domain-containing protein [Muriicola marianensis]|uniref:Membrane protein n=1 Tax=Muriicola marianensis TaxID=1324801 RepID=A0ABQ1QQK7_9FLAO|nr:BatA domain-containing protein [Muriicola marianensis]GGD38145.1 membrane protein [Muriicola marianensis]
MLFKYPQLLWSLWLLLIPILIHLLQLRRFKPTPFTNVRLLKKVKAKSQKSQTLKRWLLLISRLGLLAALILAFAQPFTANRSAFMKQDLVIYLDNSFSMQARRDQNSLLEEAVQELIRTIPEGTIFSLFTNDSEYRDVRVDEIRNELLQLKFSNDQLNLSEIELKANSFLNDGPDALKSLVVISDFQESLGGIMDEGRIEANTFFIPLRTDEVRNVSIDTVFLETSSGNINNLHITISGNHDFGSIPVSLFNKGSLIAKSAATYNSEGTSELVFSLPGEENIEGKVTLTDTGLTFDNELYFNINTREKIRVLGIGTEDEFLIRLFDDNTSQYRSVSSLDQASNLIADQDLVILNQLNAFPSGTVDLLREYTDRGGSLVLIPSLTMKTEEFNRLLGFYGLSFGKRIQTPMEITDINYAHPLFRDVFKDAVTNFQYPSAKEFFVLNGRADKILGFSNESPFLAARGKSYVFTTSLSPVNTNFTASPLVVPTLYAMAMQSRSLPTPYYLLGSDSSEDVAVQLGEDRILSLKKGDLEFIPRQQSVGRNTRLWFSGAPQEAGTFALVNAPVDRSFSFNFPRAENDLTYLPLDEAGEGIDIIDSVSELFERFENDSRVTGLWKWFVILAVLFLLAEIIIQKAMK